MKTIATPLRSRLGLWQARLAVKKTKSALRSAIGLSPRPTHSADGGPWVRHEMPGPEFVGETLSWTLTAHPESAGTGASTLEVTLHRSPCNEIGSTTLVELEKLATFVKAGAGGARALLFHSSVKRGFSAGADLRELYAGLVAGAADKASWLPERVSLAHGVRGFIDRIHAVFNTFDMAPLTTIAVIHGVCFGGGFELALTADILIADKSARFAFPELRLGLVPGFGGIPRLRRDLGNAVVRDLLFTGRSLNAKRAREVGLVSQVVARGEALGVARKVAEQAARFDPVTTAHAKAFTKPLPIAELEREKDLFIEMMGSPVVEAALKRFVESTSLRPYLP